MSFREGIKNIWKKLKDFWVKNLERDHKKISTAFGILLMVFVGAVLAEFAVLAIGGEANWGEALKRIIEASSIFLFLLISSFFGNGNGNAPKEKSKE